MLVYVFTPLGPLFWDNSISLATGILEKICARVVFMASCCICFCLVSFFVFLWTLCFFFCSIILSCFIVLFLLCFSPILSTFTNLSPDVEFSITLFSISMTFSELFADSIGDPSSSLTRSIVGCKRCATSDLRFFYT